MLAVSCCPEAASFLSSSTRADGEGGRRGPDFVESPIRYTQIVAVRHVAEGEPGYKVLGGGALHDEIWHAQWEVVEAFPGHGQRVLAAHAL
jgi:hypothetical protein